MNKNILLNGIMYIGRTKKRAYCFWYVVSYLIFIWNIAVERGQYNWGTFFPVKIVPIFIAWLYGSVNYGIAHKEEFKNKNENVLSLRKNIIFFFGVFGSVLTIIFLSKILNINLLWLLF